MAAPQIAPLPEFFELTGGMQIVLTALDALTGATVTGVAISQAFADVEYVTDDNSAPETFSDPGSPFYFGDVAA